MQGEARLRGLYRIIYSKTISPHSLRRFNLYEKCYNLKCFRALCLCAGRHIDHANVASAQQPETERSIRVLKRSVQVLRLLQ